MGSTSERGRRLQQPTSPPHGKGQHPEGRRPQQAGRARRQLSFPSSGRCPGCPRGRFRPGPHREHQRHLPAQSPSQPLPSCRTCRLTTPCSRLLQRWQKVSSKLGGLALPPPLACSCCCRRLSASTQPWYSSRLKSCQGVMEEQRSGSQRGLPPTHLLSSAWHRLQNTGRAHCGSRPYPEPRAWLPEGGWTPPHPAHLHGPRYPPSAPRAAALPPPGPPLPESPL